AQLERHIHFMLGALGERTHGLTVCVKAGDNLSSFIFRALHNGTKGPRSECAEAPGFLSMARATFAQRDGYMWTFGHSRYRLPYRAGELPLRLCEAVAFNPALAVPWQLFDRDRGCVRGMEPLPPNKVVVGVLTETHTVQGWFQATKEVLTKGWRV